MKRRKLFCLLLAAVMLFSLTSCGKWGGESKDSDQLKVGDFTLLYKGACLMKDYAGDDAIVLTLDFTNNSKKNAAYFESIMEMPVQNKEQLEFTAVYVSEESDEMVSDSQLMEVAPGETIEIKTAFALADTTSEVTILFEEFKSDKNASLTIDPSTLSWESGQSGTSSLTGNGKDENSGGEDDVSDSGLNTSGGERLRDWWNGDWYGWWLMTGCWGYYEDMDGQWWDICGTIDIGGDGMGTVFLWDTDYTKEVPMASVAVSLSNEGTTEYGTMKSLGGWFTDMELAPADWLIDPGLVDYEDMIHIDGYYENSDGGFYYDIYLRPWGTYWDDVAEEELPYFYNDWYLPLIEVGTPMPDSIG